MHSGGAPRPPPLGLTQCTAARTSGAASAGAAENPARRSTGKSCRSSPIYPTCSSVSPSSARICSYPATLFAAPCTTMVIPSWVARTDVASARRAESRPTDMPARIAQTKAAPPRMLNCFDSLPSPFTMMRQSVSTPSTSNRSNLIAVTVLEHLRAPEVVQVHDSFHDAALIDDDDRGDLVRLHDAQRFDSEHGGADRLRPARHRLAGGEREHGGRRPGHHQPPQGAAGQDPCHR